MFPIVPLDRHVLTVAHHRFVLQAFSWQSEGRRKRGKYNIGRRREKKEAEIRKRGREGGRSRGRREGETEEVLYIERRDRTKARGWWL